MEKHQKDPFLSPLQGIPLSGQKDPSGRILSDENSTGTASTRPVTDFSDLTSSLSTLQSDPFLEPSGIQPTRKQNDSKLPTNTSHSSEVTARPFDLEGRRRLSQSRMGRPKIAVARRAPPSETTSQAATIRSTCEEIDTICQSTGDVYSTYSCQKVSWEDSHTLECGITDTRLVGKSGELLYTIRPKDDKFVVAKTAKIAVVVGNHVCPAYKGEKIELRPTTLKDFLKHTGKYAAYAGVDSSLHNWMRQDGEVNIRFRTTFLPVEVTDSSKFEFCAEAYSYQATLDGQAKNAIVLCTTQGTSFYQDGAETQRLFLHAVDNERTVRQYWLEAERSKHRVGGPQLESRQAVKIAAKRGKATSSIIGLEEMGPRFNVLMTIQIPLQTMRRVQNAAPQFMATRCSAPFPHTDTRPPPIPDNSLLRQAIARPVEIPYDQFPPTGHGSEESEGPFLPQFKFQVMSVVEADLVRNCKYGLSNAARISRGSEVDASRNRVSNKIPKRDNSRPITVTCVMFHTVAGGVPTKRDVVAAIDDMERLYNLSLVNNH